MARQYLQGRNGDVIIRLNGNVQVDQAPLVQAAQQFLVHISDPQQGRLAGIVAQPQLLHCHLPVLCLACAAGQERMNSPVGSFSSGTGHEWLAFRDINERASKSANIHHGRLWSALPVSTRREANQLQTGIILHRQQCCEQQLATHCRVEQSRTAPC